jgi:hypothetical protein
VKFSNSLTFKEIFKDRPDFKLPGFKIWISPTGFVEVIQVAPVGGASGSGRYPVECEQVKELELEVQRG